MENKQLQVYEALTRVQGFLDAHADRLGEVNGTGARQELDETAAQVEQLFVDQDPGRQQRRRDANEVEALREQVLDVWMRPISRISGTALTGAEGLDKLSLPPGRMSNARFVVAAREMVNAARAHEELFIRVGLAPTFLEDFTEGIDALQSAMRSKHLSAGARIGATTLLQTATRRGLRVVGIIDAFIRPFLKTAPELKRAWRQARRVMSRAAAAPETTTDQAEPVEVGELVELANPEAT